MRTRLLTTDPAPRRAWRRLVAVAALMISATACESPLAPADVAGTYVFAPEGGLRFQSSVNGTTQESILAVYDTLTIRADGSGVLSGVSEWITPPPNAPEVGPRTVTFTYTIGDRSLRAVLTAPNACINPYEACSQTFRVLGDAMIREDGAASEYREIYTRVGPPLR